MPSFTVQKTVDSCCNKGFDDFVFWITLLKFLFAFAPFPPRQLIKRQEQMNKEIEQQRQKLEEKRKNLEKEKAAFEMISKDVEELRRVNTMELNAKE